MLSKASEMFVADLGSTCKDYAKRFNRKTMHASDIAQVANHVDKYHFIASSKLPTLNKDV